MVVLVGRDGSWNSESLAAAIGRNALSVEKYAWVPNLPTCRISLFWLVTLFSSRHSDSDNCRQTFLETGAVAANGFKSLDWEMKLFAYFLQLCRFFIFVRLDAKKTLGKISVSRQYRRAHCLWGQPSHFSATHFWPQLAIRKWRRHSSSLSKDASLRGQKMKILQRKGFFWKKDHLSFVIPTYTQKY